MKNAVKITFVLMLAIAMMFGSISNVFADEELCETFTAGYKTYKTMEGEIFNFSTKSNPNSGWYGGGSGQWIKVEAKKGKDVIIDRVEARVLLWPWEFDKIGFSSGTITERPINEGDYAVISGISNTFFEFSGGETFLQFDEIKIYYHYNSSTTGSILSGGSTWIIVGIGAAAVVAIVCSAVIVTKKKKRA